jgi:hypothetical protein
MKVKEAARSSKLDVSEIAEALREESKRELSIQLVGSSDSFLKKVLAFRGTKVLSVKEAGEPNDVRWRDLQVPGKTRAVQFLITTLIMLVFVAWSGLFITWLERNYPEYTALYIAVSNIVVPKICEFANSLESHSREADRNASLFIKVAVFRCFNSAVCLLIIINFVETISVEEDGNERSQPSLTNTVYSIIYAEMFTIPLIKLADIMGNIRKHILAPRAADQEEMNAYFG